MHAPAIFLSHHGMELQNTDHDLYLTEKEGQINNIKWNRYPMIPIPI
jgi:hypothetical protein